jgi:hypothetical protein
MTIDVQNERNKKSFQKKLLRNKKIPVKSQSQGEKNEEGLTSKVTVWIADTPWSTYPPKICLVIELNGKPCRLYFDTADDMMGWVNAMAGFVEEKAVETQEKLNQAIKEWNAFQEAFRSEIQKADNNGSEEDEGDS